MKDKPEKKAFVIHASIEVDLVIMAENLKEAEKEHVVNEFIEEAIADSGINFMHHAESLTENNIPHGWDKHCYIYNEDKTDITIGKYLKHEAELKLAKEKEEKIAAIEASTQLRLFSEQE